MTPSSNFHTSRISKTTNPTFDLQIPFKEMRRTQTKHATIRRKCNLPYHIEGQKQQETDIANTNTFPLSLTQNPRTPIPAPFQPRKSEQRAAVVFYLLYIIQIILCNQIRSEKQPDTERVFHSNGSCLLTCSLQIKKSLTKSKHCDIQTTPILANKNPKLPASPPEKGNT